VVRRGEFEGRDTTATRVGFADPTLRFTVFFAGAPAMERREFATNTNDFTFNTSLGYSF